MTEVSKLAFVVAAATPHSDWVFWADNRDNGCDTERPPLYPTQGRRSFSAAPPTAGGAAVGVCFVGGLGLRRLGVIGNL